MSDAQPDRGGEVARDTATLMFTGHHELLFSIVYNMLGSVADTEDILQETWVSWASRSRARDADPIENPRAYLVRIAVNQALARQAILRDRRESYVGPWLPEPLLTDASEPGGIADVAEAAVQAESVSIALLVIMESLTPLERAVFVLHEVFGYAHTEIADILGRTPSAVRQLAHRAREHVHARRPRYKADPHLQQQVTERFLAAGIGGDLEALLELLAPEVVFWADGGGKARAAGPRPLQGRERVARVISAGFSRSIGDVVSIRYRRVNGDPSALVFADGSPFVVLVLDLTPQGDQVCGIYAVTNPDKLSRIS